MDKSLNVLITGAGSGIGEELAKSLADDGHKVIICGRTKAKLKKVALTNKNISFFKCDVSKENDIKKFVKQVKKNFNYIDVLVNNAAVFGPIGRFDLTDSKKWRETIDINLFSVYLVSKYFLPLLLSSKTKKIVNIAGGGAFSAFPNYSAYAVTKAGVVRFSENLAEELKDLGVTVNCVSPGFVNTDLHKATLFAGEKLAGKQYQITKEKMTKGAIPIDVPIKCIKFLISENSNGLTGKSISASFDKWDNPLFKDLISEINDSDLYTQKRINIDNLTDQNLKNKLKLL